MNKSLWTYAVLSSLVLAACGALVAAALNGQSLRIRRFDVQTDADSSRIQPLLDTLDTYCGKVFCTVSTQQLRNDISAFKQVERVTISRQGFSGFSVELNLRQPILMVTNGSDSICLGPEGIPFTYWPEHGILPTFYVPNDISSNAMLEPDSSIHDFYCAALQIVSLQLNNVACFSTYVKTSDNELQLANRQSSKLLRLPRNSFRDPASSLIALDQLMNSSPLNSTELDARFPDTILIRSLKGASFHG